eukprot:3656455-Rhodomonas_salina.3
MPRVETVQHNRIDSPEVASCCASCFCSEPTVISTNQALPSSANEPAVGIPTGSLGTLRLGLGHGPGL